MRIAVHDHSGHPFQAALSRELARRGHEVLHLHNTAFLTGKGRVLRQDGDPPTFAAEGLAVAHEFPKYSPIARARHEHRYAGRLLARLREFDPDVVLSSNTPLVAQRRLWSACRKWGVGRVFWLQDFYSMAITKGLVRRLGRAGALSGGLLRSVEARVLRESDAVVAISGDFVPTLERWGVPAARIHVIENWAPIEEFPLRPRDNTWGRAHGLSGQRVVLYAGTLGMKHDPSLLLDLATATRDEPDVRIVVVSKGPGRDWLEEQRRSQGLGNLVLLDFQPYELLPDVLACADVLVSVLEVDAGQFSVPSKILANLCAGRAQLAAVPVENLAARTIERSGGGIVVAPTDRERFVTAGRRLLGDAEVRDRMAARARLYAEKHFRTARVGDSFEAILTAAAADPARRHTAPSPRT